MGPLPCSPHTPPPFGASSSHGLPASQHPCLMASSPHGISTSWPCCLMATPPHSFLQSLACPSKYHTRTLSPGFPLEGAKKAFIRELLLFNLPNKFPPHGHFVQDEAPSPWPERVGGMGRNAAMGDGAEMLMSLLISHADSMKALKYIHKVPLCATQVFVHIVYMLRFSHNNSRPQKALYTMLVIDENYETIQNTNMVQKGT